MSVLPKSVTFNVDEVNHINRPLPLVTHREAVEQLLEGPAEAMSLPHYQVIQPMGIHAVIEAAHRAYDNHLGLKLTPDYIWIMLVQGFARHVNENAEAYRSSFVSHSGRELISIYRPDFEMGSPRNDWPSCFDDFSIALRNRIGNQTHALLVDRFSTTGPVSTAVQQVALMDTVQSYFTYEVFTECGIPTITLSGEVSDWQKVAAKARGLLQFGGLDWWLHPVLPILDEFVAASAGQPNIEFWKNIYKSTSRGSGGSEADGWILKFLPYLSRYGQYIPNGLLAGEADGVSMTEIPLGLSTVPFLFDLSNYQLVGGFTSVIKDSPSVLRPALGWAVRPQPAVDEESDRSSAVPSYE